MPILAYFFIVVAVIAVSFLLAVMGARRQRTEGPAFKNLVLEIKVPKGNEKDARSAEQMFASLHGILKVTPEVQEQVSFEIASSAKGIGFYVAFPEHLRTFVESQIYAQYPEAEIRLVDDYTQGVDPNTVAVDAAYLKLAREYIFPIRTFPDFDVDPLASITGAISDLHGSERVWLQILLRPVPDIWQEEGYEYIDQVRAGTATSSLGVSDLISAVTGELSALVSHFFQSIFTAVPAPAEPGGKSGGPVSISASQESELKSIEEKLTRMGFEVVIRILSLADSEEVAQSRLRSSLASFRQFSTSSLNSFVSGEISDKKTAFLDYQQRRFNEEESYILNTEELASIFHLPSVAVETPAIAWTASRKAEPPLDLPTRDCTFFGRTNFRDQLVNFGIKDPDRRRHLYVVGKTGTGKSTLFKNMILQDMQEGRGVGVLDPHGDLIDELLDFVPDDRLDDVVIFDPADSDRPVSLNLLESPDPTQNNLMASGLVTAIKKHFEFSWGPRLEYLLNNAILTLTEVPNTTMLGIVRLLMDKNYQKYIVYKIKDPVLKEFWEVEYKQLMGNVSFHTEAIQPIQNKIGRFLATSTIRNILGQARSTIRLDEIMNEGKILFVKLAKGEIGEDNANLLGSLIISRLNFMAMQRVRIPEEERRDFYLYADEFQNFASGSFASILSEARKYHLSLHLTHQYTAQLPEEMQEAIFGNVGTIISFAVGAPDAKVLAPEFEPYFEANDLITLDRYHLYLKLMIDGMTSAPFSAISLPPPTDDERTGNKEEVIARSRERYGKPVEKVEERIRRWTEKRFDLGLAKAEEARARKQRSVSAVGRESTSLSSPPPVEGGSDQRKKTLEGEIKVDSG